MREKWSFLKIGIVTVISLCGLGLAYSWIYQNRDSETMVSNSKLAKLIAVYRKHQNYTRVSLRPYACDEPPRRSVRVTRKKLPDSVGFFAPKQGTRMRDQFEWDKITRRYNWVRTVNKIPVDKASFTRKEVMLVRDEFYNTLPAWRFIWEMRDWLEPDTVPKIPLKEAQRLCREYNKKYGTNHNPDAYYHYTKYFGTPKQK